MSSSWPPAPAGSTWRPWIVYLAGGLLFAVVVPCYVEGASLHQERGGATVLARYAFNELVSFIAGWAICLDYLILVALCAFATTDYLGTFWHEFDSGLVEFGTAAVVVLYVALVAIRGPGPRRFERVAVVVVADLLIQVTLVVLGLALLFEPDVLTRPASTAGSRRGSATCRPRGRRRWSSSALARSPRSAC